MPELDNDLDLEPGDGGEPEPKGEPEPILGKFKSQEELANAYQELERDHTRKAQEAATYRQQLEQSQYNQVPTTPPDEWEEIGLSEAKPLTQNLVGQMLSQYDSIKSNAEANMEEIIMQYENDPAFRTVGRTFKSELRRMGSAALADRTKAMEAGEAIFNMVIGKHLREKALQPKADPKARIEALKEFGIEEPTPGPTPKGGDDINERDRRMLQGLGLDKDEAKGAISDYERIMGGDD